MLEEGYCNKGEYTDYPSDDEDTEPESCGSETGDCPHESPQGCMLSYGCIYWSDQANEEAREEY